MDSGDCAVDGGITFNKFCFQDRASSTEMKYSANNYVSIALWPRRYLPGYDIDVSINYSRIKLPLIQRWRLKLAYRRLIKRYMLKFLTPPVVPVVSKPKQRMVAKAKVRKPKNV
jgi:hypothetical protein